jgi:hypothetical protein
VAYPTERTFFEEKIMHFFCLVCHGEATKHSLTLFGEKQVEQAAYRLAPKVMNMSIAGFVSSDIHAKKSAEIIHRELSFIFHEAHELAFNPGRNIQPLRMLEARVNVLPADALVLVGSPENSRHLSHLVMCTYGIRGQSPPPLSFGDILCFRDYNEGYVVW